MKSMIVFGCLLMSIIDTSFAQTNSDEVQKWQALAKVNEERAIKAEAALKYAEDDAKRMRYIAVANAVAEHSIEIPEKELAALLAVLSYNLSSQYGDTFNNKIYAALANAILRCDQLYTNKESITKSLGPDVRSTSVVMPNGNTTIEAEQNGNLRLVTDGIVKMTLSGHRAQVDQIKFTQSGSLMITAGKDNTIRIWNIRKLNLRPLVITENAPIGNLTVSPDDRQIFYTLATKPKTIKIGCLGTEIMAAELCKLITRNLTIEEWQIYVGADLEYEACCIRNPLGK